MAKFCNKCGTQLGDDVIFCTECGNKTESYSAARNPRELPQQAANVQNNGVCGQPQQISRPPYEAQSPQSSATAPVPADASEGVVSTGIFFGTMFLFTLPLVGFLACLIMCFAAKKKSLKNYAKANMIWLIIGFIASALVTVGLLALGGSVMDFVNDALNGGLGDISGF